MKPVLRVFRRDASHFSIGFTQIKYSEFFDSGILLTFIGKFEDFLLIKTSNYFRIYRFDEIFLYINASDIKMLQDNNIINNSL